MSYICKDCNSNISRYHCQDLPNISIMDEPCADPFCYSCYLTSSLVARVRWHYHPRAKDVKNAHIHPLDRVQNWRWLYVDLCESCANRALQLDDYVIGIDEQDALDGLIGSM